ncbi:MAG TPA: phage holin family protein [Flavobacteriaceae bacterium]|nr:phage holin family protein [Flavobacteriaceae bacterium]
MFFKNLSGNLQDVVLRLEDFIETNLEYYKLRLFKVSMKTAVSLINLIIFGSLFLFVLIFLSIGFALWLGYILGHSFFGFLLIGGVFLLLFILMIAFGRKIIERKVIHFFSGIVQDEEGLTPQEATGQDLNRLEMSIEEEKIRRANRNRT